MSTNEENVNQKECAMQQYNFLEPKIMSYVEGIKNIQVRDGDEFTAADEMLVEIKTKMKSLTEAFAPSKQGAKATHSAICALEKKASSSLGEAESIIKTKMKVYLAKQRELDAEKQKEINEQARIAAAVEAESEGHKGEAEEILNGGGRVPAVILESSVPKSKNTSFRTVWKWRLINEAVVDKKYLMLDEKKINKVVGALGKDAESSVGGIEVYEDTIVATKSRVG